MWNPFKKKAEEPKKQQRDAYFKEARSGELNASFAITPQVVRWISECNDAMRLSCTAAMLNCGHYPSWLPKSDLPEDKSLEKIGSQAYWTRVYVHIKIMDACKGKAEVLSPGLEKMVWCSQVYRDQYPSDTCIGCSDWRNLEKE